MWHSRPTLPPSLPHTPPSSRVELLLFHVLQKLLGSRPRPNGSSGGGDEPRRQAEPGAGAAASACSSSGGGGGGEGEGRDGRRRAMHEAYVATMLRNPTTLQLYLDSAAAAGLQLQEIDMAGWPLAFHHVPSLDPDQRRHVRVHRITTADVPAVPAACC